MKPVRTIELAHAVPVDGRSHGRTPQTMLLLDERDALIRSAAKFFPGASDREIARRLRAALLRYQTGRWRRTSSELRCPHDAEHLDAVLWSILRVGDHTPSEAMIRRCLG